ncbi:MAG: DUF229 domain-containing protein [Acidimicrobiia bacterium]|nr:DUF229 domain-containing protein [Acidimicrobiia bacterium]
MPTILSRRALLAGAPALLAAEQRPNILWLSSEDTSPNLGCYGDPHAITPTLDKLASEGVRYTNAYTVAGVCAPSRSGIITGMFPSSLGSMHMRSRAALPPHVKCFPEFLRDAGYYCTINAKTDYNFDVPPKAWDESGRDAHWRKRKAGQPFFAVFNFEVSHESRLTWRGKQFEEAIKQLKPSERRDPARLVLPPYHPDTPAVRRDWANYYEAVTAMDYQVATRLRELEEAGLLEDTIVFYWGDHGVGLPRAKRWLYDSGTRVPMIARIPEKFRAAGQGKPGSTDGQLVSMIDLAPTMLHLAGAAPAPQFQGRAFLGAKLTPPRRYIHGARDRMDERYDIIRAVRDNRYRYIRNYEPGKPYYQHMETPESGDTMKELRRLHAESKLPPAAAQFMSLSKPVEELYDLQADPHEIRNLAADPAQGATLNRLRAEHQRWMRDTRDVGLIPEPELVEGERRYGSRWAMMRAPENTTLAKRVLAAATSPNRAAAQDPHPAVRYWAARHLPDGAGLLKDPSPAVRIAAAANLRDASALAQLLEHEVESVRLMAAIALDEMGPRSRAAETQLRAIAAQPGREYPSRVARRILDSW